MQEVTKTRHNSVLPLVREFCWIKEQNLGLKHTPGHTLEECMAISSVKFCIIVLWGDGAAREASEPIAQLKGPKEEPRGIFFLALQFSLVEIQPLVKKLQTTSWDVARAIPEVSWNMTGIKYRRKPGGTHYPPLEPGWQITSPLPVPLQMRKEAWWAEYLLNWRPRNNLRLDTSLSKADSSGCSAYKLGHNC